MTTQERQEGQKKLRAPLRSETDVESVAAHYDRGDIIIRAFIDPQTKMYTCAIWQKGVTDLAQAQTDKVDYTLLKLRLKPGQRLWDIGSGYGFLLRRANELHGVSGIGSNLSRKQVEYSKDVIKGTPQEGVLDFRFQGWEDFNEKVDVIVSVGTFEHFGSKQYPKFFEATRKALPKDGKMLLHTIVLDRAAFDALSREKRKEFIEYGKFIVTDIFPHGELPTSKKVREESGKAGFKSENEESLQRLASCNNKPNYALTLEAWARNLEANRDQVIKLTDEPYYDMYMRYLTQSAYWFRRGVIDVRQFLLRAA